MHRPEDTHACCFFLALWLTTACLDLIPRYNVATLYVQGFLDDSSILKHFLWTCNYRWVAIHYNPLLDVGTKNFSVNLPELKTTKLFYFKLYIVQYTTFIAWKNCGISSLWNISLAGGCVWVSCALNKANHQCRYEKQHM